MKVIIIGAGIAGLSIGWRLAQAGAETVVFERGQPGRAATWASAGMLAATLETGNAPQAEVSFARKAMGLWPDFAQALEQASGHRIGYRRDGALVAALSQAEADDLKARATTTGAGFLARDEARAKVPGLAANIFGALWAPDEAHVDNRALGPALANALVRAGGNLQVNEAVVRIEKLPSSRIAVCTAFRVHQADAVVLAAGAWTGQIEGLPREAIPPVHPVKGEMIALVPPPGAVMPTPLVWGNQIYLVQRGSRLLVGATGSESGFDTTLTAEARHWLFTQAGGLMPELANWEIAEHWAGLRPGSPDGLPILGLSAMPNVYVASGQFRNGILLAPAIADVMQSLVLERRPPPEIAAFDPRRFQNDTSLVTDGPVQ